MGIGKCVSHEVCAEEKRNREHGMTHGTLRLQYSEMKLEV